MLWNVLYAVAAVALLVYSRRGSNAVWGTATVGVLIGLGMAI